MITLRGGRGFKVIAWGRWQTKIGEAILLWGEVDPSKHLENPKIDRPKALSLINTGLDGILHVFIGTYHLSLSHRSTLSD